MLFPWWLGGLLLAAIPVLHCALLRRSLAVSGRWTALVDRLRGDEDEQAVDDMEALLAAMRAETEAAFGADALEQQEDGAVAAAEQAVRRPQRTVDHLIFFASLALGGALSMQLAGGLDLTAGLRGQGFSMLTGNLGVPAEALLVLGGVFVGFGTRMSSGCTSGHGLCGVSRIQKGSLVATAAFFGAGIATSFAIGALL